MSRSGSVEGDAAGMGQLPLGLALDDSALFSNFLVADDNALAIASLKGVGLGDSSERFVYLWGEGSPGLTHLLQASCHEATACGRSAVYLPLAELVEHGPAIIEGLDELDVVCLDGLEVVAGLGAWKLALFSVFNRLKESGGALVAASRSTPLNLPVALADLKSRLQSGLTLQVHALDDRQKREALILRARQRGMQMSDAVADYIMLRSARDLPALIDVLDRLDASTLQQQRQLTVPLVKQTLGW